jgi:hypothetical protein
MHAVLAGFAAVAPRSALPNLIEILGTLLTKANDTGGSGGATQWMNEILMSVRVIIYSQITFVFRLLIKLPTFRTTLCQAKQDRTQRPNSSKLWQGEFFLSTFRHFFYFSIYLNIHSRIRSRSLKKTREAAQQFTLVARGLEGSNFGYSSLTM